VLSLKLRSYLHSLAKSLGQHAPASFATVGGKNVLVLMKTAELESMLIIPKDKFKEAVEEFKKKASMLG
jgi:Na+/citrate or Na+/malate symporter